MHHFHSTDLLTRAHLEISSLVSHYFVSWWSDRLLQDDFFVTLGTCFAKGWVVSSRVGVSAIFAVFDLSRIFMWIGKASMGFVTVDEMNSVSFFHFDSSTCCHFIHMSNINGVLKSKQFPIQTRIFSKKRVGEGGHFHLPPCR